MEVPKSTDAAAIRQGIVEIAYAYGGKPQPGVLRAMVNPLTGRCSTIWLLEDGTYLLRVGEREANLHPDGSMSDGIEEVYAAIAEDHQEIETVHGRWRKYFAKLAARVVGGK